MTGRGGDGATATTWPWRHRHSRSKRQPACRNLTDARPRLKGTRGLELKVCVLGRLILSGARIPVQRIPVLEIPVWGSISLDQRVTSTTSQIT
jgi:hypothetical protein